MNTRKVASMSGAFGYELDLGKLTAQEKQEVRKQVEEYHKYAPLIQNGRYYRLSNPFVDETGAWAFVAQDQSELLLNVVMLETHGNMTQTYVRLKGLKKDAFYREERSGCIYPADALMEVGCPMPLELGAYQAYQYYFVKVSDEI